MITKSIKASHSEADLSAPVCSNDNMISAGSREMLDCLPDNAEPSESLRNTYSMPGSRSSNAQSKIKTLPPSVVKDIEQKNIARKLVGLSPIIIKIRRCIACGSAFESAGNRTCGCSNRSAGTIAGREII